jgi:hypothetical protein
MEKDPAFLFYPQRWLEGTAEFSPAEKGIYIDLLSHQHQKGSLPDDTKKLCRIVGLTEQEFLELWKSVKCKFKQTDNRLVNQTLERITTKRLTKGLTNKVTGTFASLIRLKPLTELQKVELKKSFKPDAFLSVPTERLTERLTEWLEERLKSIININGNINSIRKGVKGENLKGVRFDENLDFVFFEDESFQEIGNEQRFMIKEGRLSPIGIIKGSKY